MGARCRYGHQVVTGRGSEQDPSDSAARIRVAAATASDRRTSLTLDLKPMAFLSQVSHDGPVYVPPREFVSVTPQIYISTLPHPRSIPFLRERTSINSVLFLSPKDPSQLELAPEVRQWIENIPKQQRNWLQVEKVKGWQGKIVATQATIKAGLEFVIAAKAPILISGFNDVDSAALLIACLRKLQCWDMTSIQDEMGRSIQLSLDALHLRFVNQFCSLTPTCTNACYENGARDQDKVKSSDPACSAFVLPRWQDLPDWLWYGYRSPSALLYGHEYMRSDLSTRELTWHPTMRITYRRLPFRPPRFNLTDDESDPLPTPRCRSSATSPERGNPFNDSKDAGTVAGG